MYSKRTRRRWARRGVSRSKLQWLLQLPGFLRRGRTRRCCLRRRQTRHCRHRYRRRRVRRVAGTDAEVDCSVQRERRKKLQLPKRIGRRKRMAATRARARPGAGRHGGRRVGGGSSSGRHSLRVDCSRGGRPKSCCCGGYRRQSVAVQATRSGAGGGMSGIRRRRESRVVVKSGREQQSHSGGAYTSQSNHPLFLKASFILAIFALQAAYDVGEFLTGRFRALPAGGRGLAT